MANNNKNTGLFTMRVFTLCRPELTQTLEQLQWELNIETKVLDQEILTYIEENIIEASFNWNVIFLDLELLERDAEAKEIIERFLPTTAGINSYWATFSIDRNPSNIIPNLDMPQLTQVQGNYLEDIANFYDFGIKSIRNSKRYLREQSRHFFLLYQLSCIVDRPLRILFNGIGVIGPVITLLSSLLSYKAISQLLLFGSLSGSGFPLSQLVQKRDPKTTFKPLYPLKLYAIFIIILDAICLYQFQDLISLVTCIEVILGSIIFYQLWILYAKPVQKLELCRLICSRELDYSSRSDYPGQESTDPWKQKQERPEARALRQLKNFSRYGFTFPPNPWNWRHVFLSHRNSDLGIQITELIYNSLKKRSFAIPFADFADIKEGKFRYEISDALSRCGTFISILTPDTPKKQEWVERELNAAFYFYVQFGQPYICIIEAGVSAVDLSLDEQLLKMIENDQIPVVTIDNNQAIDKQLLEKGVASRIETTIFRDYPIRLLSTIINRFISILYFLLCLLFPFSLLNFILSLQGNYKIDNLFGLLIFSFTIINVFAISGYMSIPAIFNRFTASRFSLDEANPTLLGVEEAIVYFVLWVISISLVITVFWNKGIWTITFISMLSGIVINLFSPLFVLPIWQGRKQYYYPPNIHDE